MEAAGIEPEFVSAKSNTCVIPVAWLCQKTRQFLAACGLDTLDPARISLQRHCDGLMPELPRDQIASALTAPKYRLTMGEKLAANLWIVAEK